jgi:hypothetical protein
MSDAVPSGAFPECEQFEQTLATTSLGGPKKAFTSRKNSLVEMRNVVNADHLRTDNLEARVIDIEAVIRDRPF